MTAAASWRIGAFSATSAEFEQFVLGGCRPDHEVRPHFADAFEFGDRAEVNEVGRLGEAELHHRDEAVSARQRTRVLAEVAEQRDRLGDRLGPMIAEGGGNHVVLPAGRRRFPGVEAAVWSTGSGPSVARPLRQFVALPAPPRQVHRHK